MSAPDVLPTDAPARKAIPVATGFVDYFPDAMVAVAELSRIGNDQHNPGKPLFWDRSKSTDEADALMRHFVQRGTLDTDGVRHSTKVAWRAMALLQKEIEAERTNAKLPGPRVGCPQEPRKITHPSSRRGVAITHPITSAASCPTCVADGIPLA